MSEKLNEGRERGAVTARKRRRRHGGRGTTGPFPLPYRISPSPTRPAVSAHLAPHPPAAPSRRVAGKPLYIPTQTPAPRHRPVRLGRGSPWSPTGPGTKRTVGRDRPCRPPTSDRHAAHALKPRRTVGREAPSAPPPPSRSAQPAPSSSPSPAAAAPSRLLVPRAPCSFEFHPTVPAVSHPQPPRPPLFQLRSASFAHIRRPTPADACPPTPLEALPPPARPAAALVSASTGPPQAPSAASATAAV